MKLKIFETILVTPEDPTTASTVNPDTLLPWEAGALRRQGRPKNEWWAETAKQYCQTIRAELPPGMQGQELDLTKHAHRQANKKVAATTTYVESGQTTHKRTNRNTNMGWQQPTTPQFFTAADAGLHIR